MEAPALIRIILPLASFGGTAVKFNTLNISSSKKIYSIAGDNVVYQSHHHNLQCLQLGLQILQSVDKASEDVSPVFSSSKSSRFCSPRSTIKLIRALRLPAFGTGIGHPIIVFIHR